MRLTRELVKEKVGEDSVGKRVSVEGLLRRLDVGEVDINDW
jgi:hypothetical protein